MWKTHADESNSLHRSITGELYSIHRVLETVVINSIFIEIKNSLSGLYPALSKSDPWNERYVQCEKIRIDSCRFNRELREFSLFLF